MSQKSSESIATATSETGVDSRSAFNVIKTANPDKNELTITNFINLMNHSKNQNMGNSQCISERRFCSSLVDVKEVDSVFKKSAIRNWKSLSNVNLEFLGSEVNETSGAPVESEFESKYCRSNPLNNVPWAKEKDDKTDEVFEANRLRSSPTESGLPDFSNWAALFLENNPSY